MRVSKSEIVLVICTSALLIFFKRPFCLRKAVFFNLFTQYDLQIFLSVKEHWFREYSLLRHPGVKHCLEVPKLDPRLSYPQPDARTVRPCWPFFLVQPNLEIAGPEVFYPYSPILGGFLNICNKTWSKKVLEQFSCFQCYLLSTKNHFCSSHKII